MARYTIAFTVLMMSSIRDWSVGVRLARRGASDGGGTYERGVAEVFGEERVGGGVWVGHWGRARRVLLWHGGMV
jgi:hypothetical protein